MFDDGPSMGEYEEMYGLCEQAGREAAEPKWRTREGVVIPVRDMTDSHLTNAIRFLERREESIRLHIFLATFGGPGPSGEAAQDAYDAEVGRMADADFEDVYPPYRWLIDERDRRGIQ